MVKNPTKAQVQTVIDNLEKAKSMANGHCPVDMMVAVVETGHPCGTPMCHGGWYALATESGPDYDNGADRMAKDLGLAYRGRLAAWAMSNPVIWGNKHGAGIFCDGEAFGVQDKDLKSLDQIIDHWRGVMTRLPE